MTGFLLDTHTLMWWWLEPDKLSNTARQAIENPRHQIFVSAVNLWEMSIKHHKGKLSVAKPAIDDFETLIQDDAFDAVAIKLQHARLAGQLPQVHADPFIECWLLKP